MSKVYEVLEGTHAQGGKLYEVGARVRSEIELDKLFGKGRFKEIKSKENQDAETVGTVGTVGDEGASGDGQDEAPAGKQKKGKG